MLGTSETRIGDWMLTAGGRAFWPLDPRAEEVDIRDIAHSLALQCRFGGHSLFHYSVAQHSCYVSDVLLRQDKLLALWGLLHDAGEAYASDVIRPIKLSLVGYAEIESRLETCIAECFGLAHLVPPEAKRVDKAVLSNEVRDVMNKLPREWHPLEPPIPGLRIRRWPIWYARWQFLRRFFALSTEQKGLQLWATIFRHTFR